MTPVEHALLIAILVLELILVIDLLVKTIKLRIARKKT